MSREETIKSKPKKRIYQIDLFRFLAAIAVVFYHYLFRGYMADNMSDLRFTEIGNYFKYGYLGVDLFFIISGFVIALSIKTRNLKDFCVSRITRLYPSYWLSILLTSTVVILFGAPRFTVYIKQVILNLTMFQNYFNISPVDSVYWTLFIEMKFYIFVIGIYLILNKIKEIKFDYLIYSWLLLSITYIFLNNLFVFKVLNYFLILEWSSYFIAGMIFYQIYTKKLSIKYIILLGITIFISLFHSISRIERLELKFNTTFSPFYISGFILIFYILMLLVSCGKLTTINSPKLIKFGLLTYPLYLLHQNIGFVIFNQLGTESNKYLILFLTIIFILFLSYVISEIYEPRISNYLKAKLKLLTTRPFFNQNRISKKK